MLSQVEFFAEFCLHSESTICSAGHLTKLYAKTLTWMIPLNKIFKNVFPYKQGKILPIYKKKIL